MIAPIIDFDTALDYPRVRSDTFSQWGQDAECRARNRVSLDGLDTVCDRGEGWWKGCAGRGGRGRRRHSAAEPVTEISVVRQAVQGLSHHDEIPQVVQELTPQHSAVELHVLGQAAAAEAAKADARALRAEARVALEKARVASVKAEEATRAAEIAEDLIQRHPDAVTRPGSSQAA